MTRVLVVDDKEENRYYLQRLLTGHGHDVELAHHGAEALGLARRTPPELIVSDLLMPVMDGYTLLRHWKVDQRLRHIPFMVYTATYTEAADEQLAYDLGADAFILKPAEPEEFLARIHEVQVATAPTTVLPNRPSESETDLLKTYSATLIRKLEEKTLQLEDTNRALQEDIAQRELVEEALRSSEAEVRLLIESIPHIVWVAGPEGQDVRFNQRWTDHTGLTAEQSADDGWIQAFPAAARDAVIASWYRWCARGEPFEVEFRLRRADGSCRWMLARGVPFRDRSGAVVKWFGTGTDIDDMKQAQARLTDLAHEQERATQAATRALSAEQLANEELRGVSQLRSSFLTAVSHEVRTPLTIVLGLAESLDRHHARLGTEQRLELTRRMQTNAQRLGTLLDDLLDLNKLADGQLVIDRRPHDLRELVTEAIAEAVDDDHRVTIDLPSVDVHVDRARISRVLISLVANATIHTPAGTPVEVAASKADGTVVLRVVDHGPGIALTERDRIFEPFEQGPSVPQHRPGTGIGLSLARDFVRLHDGRLWVEDTPGGGATFVVVLPRPAAPTR